MATPPRITGALLIAASAVVAASAAPGVPAVVETIGFALLGAAVCAFADIGLGGRRAAALAMPVVLLAVGDRLAEHAVAVDRLWAVPVAMCAYLLWRATVSTPRGVIVRALPALAAVLGPIAMRATVDDALLLSTPVLPFALLCSLLAIPRARAATVRAQLRRDQADLDAVVMANLELRNVGDAGDAARRIARIATELLDADGAVVWLQGPGRLLCAGGHGRTPPPDRSIAEDSTVDRVLNSGSVAADPNEIVLPLTASGGVFGAVTVNGARRESAMFVASVLQVFGAQAGYTLERLRAVEGLIDSRYVDPVTGVGNRMAATASLATMRPGDAVLLLAVEDLDRIRELEGDARADLTLGQIGLHLRTATRAGDLVARFGDDVFFVMVRDLDSGAEAVVTRLLESWETAGIASGVRAGAALHFADRTPLDTLDRAIEALDAARDDRRSPLGVAAERATWGPAS